MLGDKAATPHECHVLRKNLGRAFCQKQRKVSLRIKRGIWFSVQGGSINLCRKLLQFVRTVSYLALYSPIPSTVKFVL